MAERVSRPSISGMSMSRMTMSGLSLAILASAIRPLAAVPATSIWGSPERTSETRRRTATASSTTSTRILRMRLPVPEVRVLEGVHAENAQLLHDGLLGERFYDVAIGPLAQRADDLALLRLGRDHDQADRVVGPLGPDRPDELDPVHLGHVPVDHGDVGVSDLPQQLERLLAVRRLPDFESELAEHPPEDVPDRPGIVDHERPHRTLLLPVVRFTPRVRARRDRRPEARPASRPRSPSRTSPAPPAAAARPPSPRGPSRRSGCRWRRRSCSSLLPR